MTSFLGKHVNKWFHFIEIWRRLINRGKDKSMWLKNCFSKITIETVDALTGVHLTIWNFGKVLSSRKNANMEFEIQIKLCFFTNTIIVPVYIKEASGFHLWKTLDGTFRHVKHRILGIFFEKNPESKFWD